MSDKVADLPLMRWGAVHIETIARIIREAPDGIVNVNRQNRVKEPNLTDQRMRALVFIVDHEREHGWLPGSIQVGEALGIKDRGAVVRDFTALETLGYIERGGTGVAWRTGSTTDIGRTMADAWRSVLVNLPWRPKEHPHVVLASDAIVKAGRTMFPAKVAEPGGRVLKPGRNNVKLGSDVREGRRWGGLPIYSLTLQERATCPRACRQYATCYGNHMHRAIRYRHGKALLEAIEADLAALAAEHPGGILVRLHQLGDFYSTDYVYFWTRMMQRHQKLHLFGYTAWLPDTRIGGVVHTALNGRYSRRCFIRYSGSEGTMSARVMKRGGAIDKATEVICPEQTGRVATCGECALCWTMSKRVVFLLH